MVGVGLANVMFGLPIYSFASKPRLDGANLAGECVATFGLTSLVWACSGRKPAAISGVVATYIAGGFWFTPTDFANPAVVLARTLSDSFAGIRMSEAPAFVGVEIVGAAVAVFLFAWLPAAIGQLLKSVMPQECANSFANAGYMST